MGAPAPCTEVVDAQFFDAENDGDYGINDAEIALAYQLNKLYESGEFGAGQTVALFEEEPFNRRNRGLPARAIGRVLG